MPKIFYPESATELALIWEDKYFDERDKEKDSELSHANP